MAHKRNLKRWDDWLSRLDPTRFEALVAEYFHDQGYRVDHVGAEASRQRYDGGIDLKLYKDDAYVVVQCKNWNAYKVPHNAVHELLGVMLTQRANGAILVTSSEITEYAKASAAEDARIRLIDGAELRVLLADSPAAARLQKLHGRSNAGIFARWRVAAGFAIVAIALVFAVSLVNGALSSFKDSPGPQSTNLATVESAPLESATGASVNGETVTRSTDASSNVSSSGQDRSSAPASPARKLATRAIIQQSASRKIDGLVASALNAADPYRPIDHEPARLAARQIAGVRSVVWMDQTHLIVRVDSAEHRSMQMIDDVCDALDPLGDTLSVVVALQNANARNGDEMETLLRNCQLAEGRRAFGQRKRQIDSVSPEVRAQFKAMQERNQPKR